MEKKTENYLYTKGGNRIEPDFLIQHNGKVVYAEYFGLFVENPTTKLQKEYYTRTLKKLDFFISSDLNFIAIYQQDLKQSLDEIINWLENLSTVTLVVPNKIREL